MQIILDSCIYDKLYENKEITNKIVKLISSKKIVLYGTGIQQSQIAANDKEIDKEKVNWCLNFNLHYVNNVSAPFCWGVNGAGWGKGTWITKDQQKMYNQIEPNAKKGNHTSDRAIAVAKLDYDILVTEDKDFRKALLKIEHNKKIFNWDEFKAYISKLN